MYLSCLFYILKPQDATIRGLFYTLFFKVVQYFWIWKYVDLIKLILALFLN